MITISDAIKNLIKTYVQYPPRKLQSETYTGPLTISDYEKIQNVRERLAKEGFSLPPPLPMPMPMPTGN